MAVKAVFFDVGETLVDETRWWSEHARLAGVSPILLAAALGVAIERGADHRDAFGYVGVDVPGEDVGYVEDDLYPDARPCLVDLTRRGVLVGVAGNQGARLEEDVRRLGLEVELVASSVSLRARKPEPEFFERLLGLAGVAAGEAAYVGDRVDNDVVPARRAGLLAVHVRRGPWGRLQRGAEQADVRVDSLDELPGALLGC